MKQTYELWSYDVWGNKDDGYEVNDRYCFDRAYIVNVKPVKYNQGTEREFTSYPLSDYAIKKAFGVSCAIDTEGDDRIICVNRKSDGYPIGEMILQEAQSV